MNPIAAAAFAFTLFLNLVGLVWGAATFVATTSQYDKQFTKHLADVKERRAKVDKLISNQTARIQRLEQSDAAQKEAFKATQAATIRIEAKVERVLDRLRFPTTRGPR